ncbi:MAG: hypothetical protein KC476_02300 [Cyanobacteria bacterium HKST-UBA06]|nr:hypothetical protein [Cyanobacteria bacterium HKST-UBA06]
MSSPISPTTPNPFFNPGPPVGTMSITKSNISWITPPPNVVPTAIIPDTRITQPAAGTFVTPPDQIHLQAAALATYYNKLFNRYQYRSKRAVLTRYGRIALETLNTLRPSVQQALSKHCLKHADYGSISGRTLLGLIKAGAMQRPNCVLTNHFMAQMLGAWDETQPLVPFNKAIEIGGKGGPTTIAVAIEPTADPDATVMAPVIETAINPDQEQEQKQQPQQDEAPPSEDTEPVDAVDVPPLDQAAIDKAAFEALDSLDTALNELERLGLIRIESANHTRLLHPYSPKATGHESMFGTLLRQWRQKLQAPAETDPEKLKAQQQAHADALNKVRNHIFILNTIFFIEDDLGPISGWDVLGLIVEGTNRMLGDMPVASITGFFKDTNDKAVCNAIEDLVNKLGIVAYTDDTKRYVKPMAFAEAALRLKR